MRVYTISSILLVSTLIISFVSGFITTTTATKATNNNQKRISTNNIIKRNMMNVGDVIPPVEMQELTKGAEKPETLNLAEVCKGKKVAIFGVPGAFTPGCSKSHLPSFIDAQDALKEKGVELTICVATNDAYVMEAWGTSSGGSDAGIRFFSDSTGALTKQWGLAMENRVGIRTKRFSLIADDNTITHVFSSENASSDTWAPKVLAAL